MTTKHHTEVSIEFGPKRTPEEVAEIRAALQEYTADRIRLSKRHDELLSQYGDQWVAMHDGKLFCAPDLHELIDTMRAANVDPAKAAVRYLTRTPIIMIQRS